MGEESTETRAELSGGHLSELERQTAAIAANLRSAVEAARELQELMPAEDQAQRIVNIRGDLYESIVLAKEFPVSGSEA